MGGTVSGGRQAALTVKEKYGSDFYAKIGAIGGKNGHTGGFYANRELASKVGRIGGRKSKRGWSTKQRLQHSETMKGTRNA